MSHTRKRRRAITAHHDAVEVEVGEGSGPTHRPNIVRQVEFDIDAGTTALAGRTQYIPGAIYAQQPPLPTQPNVDQPGGDKEEDIEQPIHVDGDILNWYDGEIPALYVEEGEPFRNDFLLDDKKKERVSAVTSYAGYDTDCF